jgi:hypothetical protein
MTSAKEVCEFSVPEYTSEARKSQGSISEAFKFEHGETRNTYRTLVVKGLKKSSTRRPRTWKNKIMYLRDISSADGRGM